MSWFAYGCQPRALMADTFSHGVMLAVYPQQRKTKHEVCMVPWLCGQDKKSMGTGLTARRRSGYGAHVSHEQYATVAA